MRGLNARRQRGSYFPEGPVVKRFGRRTLFGRRHHDCSTKMTSAWLTATQMISKSEGNKRLVNSRTNLKWFLKFCFERKLQRSAEAFDWTRDLSIVSQNKRSLDCIPLIDADAPL